jgi:hypothetical protein
MRDRFERFIGIDWSGASKVSGQKVYVAEAYRHGSGMTVHSVIRARDRQAIEEWLAGSPLEPAPAWRGWPGPGRLDGRARRLVALDFAFGFPAAFELPELEHRWSWDELGRWAAALEDARENGLNSIRREIAADPLLARQFRLRGGDPATMHLRICDGRAARHRPASVFHLIGPSQVGLGSITGIAMLHRLRQTEGVAIWPFDPPDQIDTARVVLVEIFPRMWLDDGIRKNELPERVRQIESWKSGGVAFNGKAELAAASAGDALDAAAAAIGAARCCYKLPSPSVVPEDSRRREGWIVGAQVP